MSKKPRRRWYQFSLRGMLAIVTLLSIPLARIAYLLRMADFHERQEREHYNKIDGKNPRNAWALAVIMQNEDDRKSALNMSEDTKLFLFLEGREALIHRELAQQYRRAAYRPWAAVDESPPEWLRP